MSWLPGDQQEPYEVREHIWGRSSTGDQPIPVFTFCTSTLVSSHLEWTLLSGNWQDCPRLESRKYESEAQWGSEQEFCPPSP